MFHSKYFFSIRFLDHTKAEIIKTSSIIEPVFIQELKEIIHEVTSGKIKIK